MATGAWARMALAVSIANGRALDVETGGFGRRRENCTMRGSVCTEK